MVYPIFEAVIAEKIMYEFSWIFIAVFAVFMVLLIWIIKEIISAKQR